jgi:hypothetical protein
MAAVRASVKPLFGLPVISFHVIRSSRLHSDRRPAAWRPGCDRHELVCLSLTSGLALGAEASGLCRLIHINNNIFRRR